MNIDGRDSNFLLGSFLDSQVVFSSANEYLPTNAMGGSQDELGCENSSAAEWHLVMVEEGDLPGPTTLTGLTTSDDSQFVREVTNLRNSTVFKIKLLQGKARQCIRRRTIGLIPLKVKV